MVSLNGVIQIVMKVTKSKLDRTQVQYLKQHQELYGDTIYVSESEENSNELNDLDQFKNEISSCNLCPLGETRTNFVFGSGNSNADIVFVGEAPGEKEDLQGVPFVGRSGKLLDKMLEAINLDRESVFIVNVLKCRPPKNRVPLPSEVELCEQYLKKQLEIINPKLIVTLGRISSITLLKSKESLSNLREKIHLYEGIDLLATYHPAVLLRNPNLKRPAWDDFKVIRDKYLK